MRKQIFAAVVVNFLSILYGISVGWAAPNMILFQSEDSPVGAMNADQMSLIVSMLCVGGTVGTIICGLAADFLGRKASLLIIGVPQLISNVLLIVGNHYYYIYAARFLVGLAGGGSFIMIPMFVSEISHESIRGALGSAMAICVNLGIVTGYVLASWMEYSHVPYVSIAITCAFMGIFVWLPESPDYLAHLKKTEAAEKSYSYYGLTRAKPEATELGQETEAIDSVKSSKISTNDFKDIAVLKGVLISLVLILFADTAGIIVITSFLTELFNWAQIQMDVYVATIAVGVIQVAGAVFTAIFVDRFGRRMLLIWSCVGTAICFYALGFYFYILPQSEYKDLVKELHWLPVVSLSAAVLIAAAGVVTVPFFLIAELLPVKLRGAITSVSLSLSWMFAFLVTQFYHTTVDYLSIAGTIWMYAVSCTIEIFFVYFFLPETKNLTIDEIQQRLRKRV